MTVDSPSMPPGADDDRTLGQRLADGRRARGLDLAGIAAALKVPHTIIEAIERDDLERLGPAVYARGYLLSYARLVGVAEAHVSRVFDRRVEVPEPLQTSVQVSHARYLLDRYARKGAYLVLTASIVLPVLWFKDQLKLQGVDLRSLDAPVATVPLPASPAAPTASDDGAAVDPLRAAEIADRPATSAADDEYTVVASLAPFYQRNETAADTPDSAAPNTASALQATAGWQLEVSDDSWVEVTGTDGRRLEYGLLRAGDQRHFPAGTVASIAIGNASGVRLQRDGAPVDLEPFRRANVARFTVSSDGRLHPGNG